MNSIKKVLFVLRETCQFVTSFIFAQIFSISDGFKMTKIDKIEEKMYTHIDKEIQTNKIHSMQLVLFLLCFYSFVLMLRFEFDLSKAL